MFCSLKKVVTKHKTCDGFLKGSLTKKNRLVRDPTQNKTATSNKLFDKVALYSKAICNGLVMTNSKVW